MEETRESRVVVGYDGGPDADLALAWASETAHRQNLPMLVVVAVSAMDPLLVSGFQTQVQELAAQWRSRAEKLLAESGVCATTEIRPGPVIRVLLKAVTADDLLVLGSSGHAPFIEAIGGSVSQHLARHAPCPVVVVRPARYAEAGRIVVGLDGSDASVAAARFACERARTTGEQVLAVHGYPRAPWAHEEREVEHHHVSQRRDRAMSRLAEWLAPVRADYPEVLIVAHAAAEPAHQLIVHLSERASLVVLGARGRDAFADLLLGSTTQDALHRARCPVAVVR